MRTFACCLMMMFPLAGFAAEQSPYAGEEHRAIKSLSEQEIEALRRGDGMGFAMLAELNHFPGPKHVLAVADRLRLSATQIEATEALFEDMRSRAVALGEELIAAEARLDRAFTEATVTADRLLDALLEIGEIKARLRFVHLESHLRQRSLLSPEQISKYDEIRGYGHADAGHRSNHGHH